jgi:hypothetical protein
MVLSDKKRAAEIVIQVCDAQAPRFRSDPKAIYGVVFEKVVENAARKTDPLRNPNGFVHRTAWFESRRACRRERAEILHTLPELDELAGTRNCRRVPHSSVLDLLAYREAEEYGRERAEAVRVAFLKLPLDQQEALLVVEQARGYEVGTTDLPNRVDDLAKLRGCSRTHIYNLSNRAVRAIRAAISFRENNCANRS